MWLALSRRDPRFANEYRLGPRKRGPLGAALCRALHRNGSKLLFPAEHFRWTSSSQYAPQLEAAVQGFVVSVGATDRWEICWTTGRGTMSGSADDQALGS